MKENESKVKIHSAIGLTKKVIELFYELGFEVLAYSVEVHSEINFLLINEESKIREWDKAFTTSPHVRFIGWGIFSKVDEFLLNRGIAIIDPKQFQANEEYRVLLKSNFRKESTLHIQDKLLESGEEIIKASITHPLRFGHTIDLITATAHDKKYDLLSLRHYLGSMMLWCAYLKQIGKIGYPFQVEYVCTQDKFAINFILHTPNFYLENMLEYFQEPKDSIQKESLLWECYHSTDYLEISHFHNAQKMNIMAIWYSEKQEINSLNVFEVESIKRNWEKQELKEAKVLNADEKVNSELWEELEEKPLEEMAGIKTPELENAPEELQSKEELQQLVVAVILKQVEQNPDNVGKELSPEQVMTLMEGTAEAELLRKIDTDDLDKVLETINDVGNKEQVLSQLEKIEDQEKLKDDTENPELVLEQAKAFVHDLSSQMVSQLSPEDVAQLKKEQILEHCDLSNYKKEILESVITAEDVNVEHPCLIQAAQVLAGSEISQPEILHKKMEEIAEFIQESAKEKNPMVDRVLEALQAKEINFNQAQDMVESILTDQYALDLEANRIVGTSGELTDTQNRFSTDKELEEEIQLVKGQKVAADEAVNLINDYIEELIPDLKNETKKSILDDFIKNFKGNETEAEFKKKIEEVTLKLNEELIKVNGQELPEDDYQKTISDVVEKFKEQREMVKGQKDNPEEVFTLSSLNKEEKEDLQKILNTTLSLSDEMLTVKNFAKTLGDLTIPNVRVKAMVEKDKFEIAKKLRKSLEDLAQKKGLKVEDLSKEDIDQNLKQLVKEVTEKIIDEKQEVKEQFLTQLKDEPSQRIKGATETLRDDKLDLSRHFQDLMSELSLRPDLSDQQIIQDVSSKTNVPVQIVAKALENTRQQDSVRVINNVVKQIVVQANNSGAFAASFGESSKTDEELSKDLSKIPGNVSGPEVQTRIQISDLKKLSENSPDNDDLITLGGSKGLQEIKQKNSPEQTTHKSEDRAIQLRLRQKEEENKKLKAENQKMKVLLETQTIKDRVKAEALSENKAFEESVGAVTETLRQDEVSAIVREAKVVNGPERTVVAPKSPLKLVPETKPEVDKKLALDIRKKEELLEREISKLLTEKEKKASAVELLKKQNAQQAENYERKIKDLERQMSAKPVIKELIEKDPSLDPELHKLKIQNESLSKSAEVYKRTIAELTQRVAKANEQKGSFNNFMEKEKLEKEIIDLKNKLEQTEKKIVENQKVQKEIEGKKTPVDQLKSKQEQDIQEKRELIQLRRELEKAQKQLQLLNGKGEDASQEPSNRNDKVAPKTEPGSAEAISPNSGKSKEEVLSLKQKIQEEISSKNVLQNQIANMEKTVSALKRKLEESGQTVPAEVEQLEKSINKVNTVQNFVSSTDRDVKAELASITAKLNFSQNEKAELEKGFKKLQREAQALAEQNAALLESSGAAEIQEKLSKKFAQKEEQLNSELYEIRNRNSSNEKKLAELQKELHAKDAQINSMDLKTKTDNKTQSMNASNNDEMKAELAKSREVEQNQKKELAEVRNLLSQKDEKIKSLEEKLKAPAAGAPGGALTSAQITQLQASHKKLGEDLAKATKLAADAKKELSAKETEKVQLQNRLTMLQKDFDKLKNSKR